MADTTSYTTQAKSAAIDAVREGVYYSAIRSNPLIDMFTRANSKYGLEVPWRLPGATQGAKAPNQTGGYNFTFNVELEDASGAFKAITKAGLVNPLEQDLLRRAMYEVRTFITPIAIFDLDVNAVNGKEAVIDLMVEKAKEALIGHANGMSASGTLWATSDSTTTPTPLPVIIKADPTTGICGGLDGATAVHPNWQNQYEDTTAYNTDDKGIVGLAKLLGKIHGKGGKPSCVITDATGYSFYLRAVKGLVNIPSTSEDIFKGYPLFHGIPMILDENTYSANPGTTAKHYFLDLRFLGWYVLEYVDEGGKAAFCLPMKEFRLPNQLGIGMCVVTQGNLCCWKRNVQGVQNIAAI
jgi:hypothetical protein